MGSRSYSSASSSSRQDTAPAAVTSLTSFCAAAALSESWKAISTPDWEISNFTPSPASSS